MNKGRDRMVRKSGGDVGAVMAGISERGERRAALRAATKAIEEPQPEAWLVVAPVVNQVIKVRAHELRFFPNRPLAVMGLTSLVREHETQEQTYAVWLSTDPATGTIPGMVTAQQPTETWSISPWGDIAVVCHAD